MLDVGWRYLRLKICASAASNDRSRFDELVAEELRDQLWQSLAGRERIHERPGLRIVELETIRKDLWPTSFGLGAGTQADATLVLPTVIGVVEEDSPSALSNLLFGGGRLQATLICERGLGWKLEALAVV